MLQIMCRLLPSLALLLANSCCISEAINLKFLSLTRGVVDEPQVRVPKTDRRKFKYAVLDNGLQVLAVQDPKAAKAGVAVAVSAGSFYDPPALPGLAHFCEHLLFLGSKKYPDAASFDEFMSKYDGMNNAYTAQEQTVYYNEISDAGLNELMDRFAQFFISPSFQADMVGRELDAVNSEHLKNVPDQGRRLWELMRSTARNASVVSHFYTGTTESLHQGDGTTIAALKKYHSENYCAPRMTLVLTSKRDLDEQIELAHSHFSEVPRNPDICSPTALDFKDDHPFGDKSTLGRQIEFRSESAPQLWMMFPLPPTLKSYQAQPASMLQYALGYAGPKSLISKLKAQGLVSKLGMQIDQSSAGTLIFVMFDLTPAGTKGVDSVTSSVFDYLAELRPKSGKFLKQVYPTMRQMSLVTFDYQEAPGSVMDSVSGLASSLLTYAPSDVLAGDFAIDQTDYHLVDELIQKLTPSNVNLAVSTRDFDENKDANRYNTWYKVAYADKEIPQAMRKRWAAPEKQGHELPPALKYVPSKLDLISASAGEVPKQLTVKDAVSTQVWWLGRGIFALPKAQLRIKLTVPSKLFGLERFVAMRRLHVGIVQQILEEPMEDLSNCGLDWDIKELPDGYHIAMDGYDEHLAALVTQVVGGFSQEVFEEASFLQAKQQLLDTLKDASAQMPYAHALEALNAVSSNAVFSRTSVISALESIDKTAFEAYLSDLKKLGLRSHLLATGNVDEAATRQLAATLAEQLGSQTLLSKDEAASVLVLDTTQPIEVRMANPIPGDPNSATINAYQYGVPDVAQRVKVLMLGKMISEPVYNTLRTKEQLGYIVFGSVVPHRSILELQLIVQGAKETPDTVDLRIESVLSDFQETLKNLTAAEFQVYKASIRSTINTDDQNMAQEADRFWAQIATGDECFHRKKMALEFLDSFNAPEELAAEFETFRQHPKKISVRLFGSKVRGANATQMPVSQVPVVSPALILTGDGAEDEAAAAKGRTYWPSSGICQIHRRAQ